MKLIPLTQGKFAKVDDTDDYRRASACHWHYSAVSGYAQRKSSGKPKTILLHRFIMNAPEGTFVDHINGDRLDNRRCNLRLCTHTQNLQNQKVSKKQVYNIPYKGVTFSRQSNKWRTRIHVNKKQIHLGLFSDLVEAARAYDRAALEYFGEFARLNFPE